MPQFLPSGSKIGGGGSSRQASMPPPLAQPVHQQPPPPQPLGSPTSGMSALEAEAWQLQRMLQQQAGQQPAWQDEEQQGSGGWDEEDAGGLEVEEGSEWSQAGRSSGRRVPSGGTEALGRSRCGHRGDRGDRGDGSSGGCRIFVANLAQACGEACSAHCLACRRQTVERRPALLRGLPGLPAMLCHVSRFCPTRRSPCTGRTFLNTFVSELAQLSRLHRSWAHTHAWHVPQLLRLRASVQLRLQLRRPLLRCCPRFGRLQEAIKFPEARRGHTHQTPLLSLD